MREFWPGVIPDTFQFRHRRTETCFTILSIQETTRASEIYAVGNKGCAWPQCHSSRKCLSRLLKASYSDVTTAEINLEAVS